MLFSLIHIPQTLICLTLTFQFFFSNFPREISFISYKNALASFGGKKTFFSEHIVTLRQRVAADTPAVLTYLLSCSWGQSEASRIKNQWWLKLNLFMPFISTLKISSHLFIHINITPCSCKISNLLTNYRKHKPYSAISTV